MKKRTGRILQSLKLMSLTSAAFRRYNAGKEERRRLRPARILEGIRLQHISIMDDGISLSAVLERPGQGPCPLVIVLHGFCSNKDRPHTVAACQAMREAGFATLRFDLYGHGESGGEFKNHTIFKWISNTLAVIEYARRLDFVTDVYLSGHSQGGLTAALVGAMAPNLIKGLILRAPAFLIPRCAREGRMLSLKFDPCSIPDETEIIQGLRLGANYIRTAQLLCPEDAMDRYKNPVLILHGDEDDMVPLEDSRMAAKRYKNCRLEIIPGETHHFNRYPEQSRLLLHSFSLKMNL